MIDLNTIVPFAFLIRDCPFDGPSLRLHELPPQFLFTPVLFDHLVKHAFFLLGVDPFKLEEIILFISEVLELTVFDVAENGVEHRLADVKMGRPS